MSTLAKCPSASSWSMAGLLTVQVGRASTNLTNDGYEVIVVQNPTMSLADDVTVTKRAIAAAKYPVVLVGHSYGGVVITEAGNDPKVASLAYIAAFAPDAGESVETLIANPAPGAPVPPILPPQDGFLKLDSAKFADSFAADVDPATARFMANSQVPWGVEALAGKVTAPAWKTKPSFYLVASDDRMIPPPAQRAMADRAGARSSRRRQPRGLCVEARRRRPPDRAGGGTVPGSRVNHCGWLAWRSPASLMSAMGRKLTQLARWAGS